jgi:hypothetical protein
VAELEWGQPGWMERAVAPLAEPGVDLVVAADCCYIDQARGCWAAAMFSYSTAHQKAQGHTLQLHPPGRCSRFQLNGVPVAGWQEPQHASLCADVRGVVRPKHALPGSIRATRARGGAFAALSRGVSSSRSRAALKVVAPTA